MFYGSKNPFCGMFCLFLTRYMYVIVCLFFILLYINSKACVDIVYICWFDMKNNVMDWWKSTWHTCTMCRCTIEESGHVLVFSTRPTWQLSGREKASVGDVVTIFWVAALSLFRVNSVCRKKRKRFRAVGMCNISFGRS